MEDSQNMLPLTAIIMDAMSKLEEGGTLGFANEDKKLLENAFQDRLCQILNDISADCGWVWSREGRFRTQALRNTEDIYIDLIGAHAEHQKCAAIELKYVPTQRDGNRASDAPAFAYDVLKDCLKLELTTHNDCEAVNPDNDFPVAFGFSIGLTNVPNILNGKMGGWSQNYLSALQAKLMDKNNSSFTLGPCIIESYSKNNLDGVIYRNRRHHISLGHPWTGQWAKFGDTDFHFIMLASNFSDTSSNYQHDIQDSKYIPFLSDVARKDAVQKSKS